MSKFQRTPTPAATPEPVKPKADIVPIRIGFDEPKNYKGRAYKQLVWFSRAIAASTARDRRKKGRPCLPEMW